MSNNQKLKYLSLAFWAYFALTMYWFWFYIGPVRFFGELQMSIFGKQWPVLNLIIVNLPFIVLDSYLRNRLKKQSPKYSTNSTNWSLITAFANERFINKIGKPVIVLIILAIMLSITLGQFFSKDIGTISIAELTSGKIAEHSFYAKISGYPDPHILKVKKSSDSNPRIYIILREKPEWNTPIHLIISLDKSEIEEYVHKDLNNKTITVSGLVTEGGEGKVKTWLEKAGITFADNYWTIMPKINSSNRSGSLYAAIFMTIILVSFAAFLYKKAEDEERKKGISV